MNAGANITGNIRSGSNSSGILGASFTKTGGIITGYNSDQSNGNKVADYNDIIARRSHALYINEGSRKETTAEQGMNLSHNSVENWGDTPVSTATPGTPAEYAPGTNPNTTEMNESGATPGNTAAYASSTPANISTENATATLNIYRKRKILDLFPKRCDILLDNVLVGNSTNNWKTSVPVSTFGTQTLSTTIDGRKAEVRINFQPGGVYYVRSDVDSKSVNTGKTRTTTNRNGTTSTVAVTEIQYTPILQLVDKSIGEPEFKAIK